MILRNGTKENTKGFTLVELLVSIALLAVVVGLSADIVITLVRTNTKIQVSNEIEQVANFVFLKLQNDIKNSHDADVEADGTLLLEKKDDTVTAYTPVTSGGGYSYLEWNGVPLTDVNANKGVEIVCNGDCFSVSKVAGSAKVTISLVIRQVNTPATNIFSSTVDLQDTFIVRGSY